MELKKRLLDLGVPVEYMGRAFCIAKFYRTSTCNAMFVTVLFPLPDLQPLAIAIIPLSSTISHSF
jgi:hypothetical protein